MRRIWLLWVVLRDRLTLCTRWLCRLGLVWIRHRVVGASDWTGVTTECLLVMLSVSYGARSCLIMLTILKAELLRRVAWLMKCVLLGNNRLVSVRDRTVRPGVTPLSDGLTVRILLGAKLWFLIRCRLSVLIRSLLSKQNVAPTEWPLGTLVSVCMLRS